MDVINLLVWDVVLAALHLICNMPQKEDSSTLSDVVLKMWYITARLMEKVHCIESVWKHTIRIILSFNYIQLIANLCIFLFCSVLCTSAVVMVDPWIISPPHKYSSWRSSYASNTEICVEWQHGLLSNLPAAVRRKDLRNLELMLTSVCQHSFNQRE